jgi:hypothetical protein
LGTDGKGVTSDFGGGDEQLARSRATAMAASAVDFLTRRKRCEQAMINSLSYNFLFEEPHSLIMRTKVNIIAPSQILVTMNGDPTFERCIYIASSLIATAKHTY